MVPFIDGVCGLCGKTHTSGSVSLYYRHIQLPPVFDELDGVNCIFAAR